MNESRPAGVGGFRLLTTVAALLACAAPSHGQSSAAASLPAATTVAATEGVELRAVDRTQYDELIKEHRGQVVLVDFWATWCAPCVEQFPHTVALANKLRDKCLAVVTLSMNDPSEREAIKAFLAGQKAGGLENLVSQYGAGPRSMSEFEIAAGALPHYKLYDRAGKLRHTFKYDLRAENQFTLEDIDARVAELLAEKPASEGAH